MAVSAVLIQRMVPAEAAGVAFTANPTTGDISECIIVGVAGVGETLVGGEATGEQWVVQGPNAVGPTEARVLTSNQARQIADLARAIE